MPISIPPPPFSRGRSGPTGFPSPQAPLLASSGPAPYDALLISLISLKRKISKKRLCLFVLIGALPQTLTLRAAFASSTYLLSQIHACLNPPNPLFKGAHQAFVRTRAQGHRFAVLRPASDDALLISLKRKISLKKGCALFEYTAVL